MVDEIEARLCGLTAAANSLSADVLSELAGALDQLDLYPPKGLIIQSGEMHGFYDEANVAELYGKMLDFIASSIGPGVAGGRTAGK